MNAYQTFMDRQTLSDPAHARLLALEGPARQPAPWGRYAALAASLALVIAAGLFTLGRGGGPLPLPTPPLQPGPMAVSPVPSQSPGRSGFVARGPAEGGKLMFPNIHGVDYADVSDQPQLAADIAAPEGSFTVELGREDILKLFWGGEGKPAVEHFKTDTGDFPLMLMNWAGYEITASAIYDGRGELWELAVYGKKGEDSFTLRAAPGHILPTCVVESGAVTTTVIDTEVKGWYRSCDRDGDGEAEHVCTSELLAHGVGVRFENIGSGGMRSGGDQATDLGGAMLFNAMFVTQMCHYDGGLYLDHIAHTDNIPAWRNETFETLDQARGEAAFAPYLPAAEPQGYAAYRGNKDFGAHLYYQEGDHNWLRVRWSRGYDDVSVTVWLPEDPQGYPQNRRPVDVNVPESYDWRLYDGPICDSVPQEYQMDFYMPSFRAEDMSLAVVEARGHGKDTGGVAYRFRVRHGNGVVVDYDCSGVDAQYVWGLVEATL